MRYSLDEIREELKKRLPDKRRLHCLYVAAWAKKIAELVGYSPEKAELAGLLHDIAKKLPVGQLLVMAEQNGLALTTAERGNPHCLHGRVGALIARKEFGVNDEDVLNAIAFHSGRPGMGKLEKILLLSDYMQKLITWGAPDFTPVIKEKGLDAALMQAMHFIIKFCVDNDIEDERTFETFDAILLYAQEQAEKQADREKMENGIIPTPDAYYDKSYALYMRQRLGLATVPNGRELGGYKTRDGRYVRYGAVVRSGNFGSLTAEDATVLRNLGFSHIFDLRSDAERNLAPCQNPNWALVENCPLILPEESPHQRSLIEQYYSSDNPKEKSWLASEIVRNTDIQQVYQAILGDSHTKTQLRHIFDILLQPDCTGVLFHCGDGKQRTGFAVAMVLTALGVDVLTIWLDYAASVVPNDAFMENFVEDLKNGGYDKTLYGKARYFNALALDMLRNVHKDVLRKYISLKVYLRDEIGLSEADLTILRNKFLEE